MGHSSKCGRCSRPTFPVRGSGFDTMNLLAGRKANRNQESDPGHRSRGGQAVVEFAVIGLILATMTFGVMEFGRAYYASIAVTNAARDGARVAMDPSKSDGDVTAAANEAAGSVDLSELVIARSTTVGSTSTVTATHSFESVLPLISNFWGGGPLMISHTATSRVGWE